MKKIHYDINDIIVLRFLKQYEQDEIVTGVIIKIGDRRIHTMYNTYDIHVINDGVILNDLQQYHIEGIF